MGGSKEFGVPVFARHSVSIELEFLVAWLPKTAEDPHKSEAHLLPPPLRTNSHGLAASKNILGHLRETLTEGGLPVVKDRFNYTELKAGTRNVSARRRHDKDKWSVVANNNITEELIDGYEWQPVKVCSPALLVKDESFEEVKFAVNILTSNYRLRVNPMCSFHVQVGNGENPFPAAAIMRLGSFLWAADPILSRLHAPWRRVHEDCRSIRHESRLACRGVTAEDVRILYEGSALSHGPKAVANSLDTAVKKTEHDGGDEWGDYWRWCNEVRPFMTRGKGNNGAKGSHTKPDDNGGDDSDDDNRTTEDEDPHPRGLFDLPRLDLLTGPGDDPDSPSSPPSQKVGGKRRRLQEEDRQINSPPKRHNQGGDIGRVRWDKLSDLAIANDLVVTRYGYSKISELSTVFQVDLLLRTQCNTLFGHTDVDSLSKSQEDRLIAVSEPYFEAPRSTPQQNPATEKGLLTSRGVAPILEHPKPMKIEMLNVPYTVAKWDNMAKLLEWDVEDEYTNEPACDDAVKTNKAIGELFELIRPYAESPGSQYKEDLMSPPPESTPSPPDTGDPVSTWAQVYSVYTSEVLSDPSTPESGGTTTLSDAPSSPLEPYVSESESESESVQKLCPHNTDDLSDKYKASVNEYVDIPDPMWDRIDWLPSLTYPLEDPAASYAEAHPETCSRPKVSAAQGLAQITCCRSAMCVAALLEGVNGRRLNYCFDGYLAPADEDRGRPRTVEFREAAGSLDAQWIATWARVCAGIVRFARGAEVADFVAVVDDVLDQEERDLRARAARATAAAAYEAEGEDERERERYDVCDLLEGIGLPDEAAWVRRRNRNGGFPR